jgi:hypothetical protein
LKGVELLCGRRKTDPDDPQPSSTSLEQLLPLVVIIAFLSSGDIFPEVKASFSIT